MVAIQQGEWKILSVSVENQTMRNNEGFKRFELSEDVLTIYPAGMTFKVQQATENSAVLESQGQVFFADYRTSEHDQQLSLRLTRPQFAETINIQAKRDQKNLATGKS